MEVMIVDSGPLWVNLYSKQKNKGKNHDQNNFVGSSKEGERWMKECSNNI